MYKEHSVFEPHENENAKIWRYMDFTKFVSLLDKSALFFARADKLDDPFEGSYSKANIELRPKIYQDNIPEKAFMQLREYVNISRKFFVINSWYLNEFESAAMWKLYLKSNEGIAIQSSFKRLKNCLKDEKNIIYIGKVKYIDYESDWVPEGNLFYPFIHKRKSFEHEQELRLIINEYPFKRNAKQDWIETPFGDEIYVEVELNILIDKIYLAPTCPSWLLELIKSVTNKYGLDKEALQSSLDNTPVY